MTTLRQAEQLLADFEPFTAGNLSAKYDIAGNYIVYSYETMVAGKHAKTGNFDLTTMKYSQTTSKHLNIIRRAWGF
jgi:hypothetical protein